MRQHSDNRLFLRNSDSRLFLRAAEGQAISRSGGLQKPINAQERSACEDLLREVYCVLGVPVDKVDFATALGRIKAAAGGHEPFLISTPNLNWLVNLHSDRMFREALLLSDLCTADGVAIIWLGRILGIPITERISGSDMFEALKLRWAADPIRVFFFGGEEGVAERAAATLGAEEQGSLVCAGTISPGFGTVQEMSRKDIIDAINSSHAQFLVVSLGAQKGQAWLLRNHFSLRVPVRAHFGAVINFQAGTVKRAPLSWQRLGLEWLWRIREEPHLWSRYVHDGFVLIRMLLTRVAPLAWLNLLERLRGILLPPSFATSESWHSEWVRVLLRGTASVQSLDEARMCFERVVASGKSVALDCSQLCFADARFLGLLLMLRKQIQSRGLSLEILGVKGRVERIFRLNGIQFLLSSAGEASKPND
jgi:N-acetylglucosaminyldiphosphoundecaprenol N-acetyl-beta-D-mannosaminyltransferase